MKPNDNPLDPIELMTIHDVAKYLRLSEANLYKMAQEGSIPAIRIGKVWRFKKEVLDEWIKLKSVNMLEVSL